MLCVRPPKDANEDVRPLPGRFGTGCEATPFPENAARSPPATPPCRHPKKGNCFKPYRERARQRKRNRGNKGTTEVGLLKPGLHDPQYAAAARPSGRPPNSGFVGGSATFGWCCPEVGRLRSATPELVRWPTPGCNRNACEAGQLRTFRGEFTPPMFLPSERSPQACGRATVREPCARQNPTVQRARKTGHRRRRRPASRSCGSSRSYRGYRHRCSVHGPIVEPPSPSSSSSPESF